MESESTCVLVIKQYMSRITTVVMDFEEAHTHTHTHATMWPWFEQGQQMRGYEKQVTTFYNKQHTRMFLSVT